MKRLALWLVLAVVLLASSLNLVIGGLWVVAVVLVLVLRRKVRRAAGLIVLVVVIAGGAAAWLETITPPPPASYEEDELAWLARQLPALASIARRRGGGERSGETAADATLRLRLEAVRVEELGETGGDFARRAAAVVAASRDLGRLRERAATAVGAVEDAVRRLAFTLTTPEFRDLDGRARRLRASLDDLEARLTGARDRAERESVARALEPAALAGVSFRAVREDLARVDQAMSALVRAVGGGAVSITRVSRVEYDEARGQLLREDRYVLSAAPPLGIRRLDLGSLRRSTAAEGFGQTLAFEVAGGEPRGLGGDAEVTLALPATRVSVTDRRVRDVVPVSIAPALRRIRFHRLELPLAAAPASVPVTVALDAAGPDAVLLLTAPPARLEGVTLPRYAFHFASQPGAVMAAGGRDVFRPFDGDRPATPPGRLVVELIPPTVALRNGLFPRVRTFLYTPSWPGALAVTGLAALVVVLSRRPRHPGPPAGPPGRA